MAGLRNVLLAFFFIATGGLLFGYVIGINGNVVTEGQLLCASNWSGPVGTWGSSSYGQCYDLSVWDQGLLSSLNLIGAMASSAVCFRYADVLGRKKEVQIGAALYLLGSLVAATSPLLWGVYAGFFIYGLGIGFTMHAAPVYIAEIAPAEWRGTLVSAKEMFIVVGMFIGFAMGAACASISPEGWRIMVVLAAVFALVVEVGIAFIPNSPRWLVLRSLQDSAPLWPGALPQAVEAEEQELSPMLGDTKEGSHEAESSDAPHAPEPLVIGCSLDAAPQASPPPLVVEARQALAFFRGVSEKAVEQEFNTMLKDAREAPAQSGSSAKCSDMLRYPLPLIIGCGLVFLQQVTGQPSVLYFATNIFKSAGFAGAAALSSVCVGFVKLLATLFTVWQVDLYGRRQLLMWGIGLMIFALALLSYAFLFRSCTDQHLPMGQCPQEKLSVPRPWAITMVIALMLYVSGYQIGFGPISWLMISEIFPLGIRGSALSTAAMVNFGANILMTLCQTALMNALTPSGTFFSYLALAIVSFAFVAAIVPETKGKTLEEIEAEMTGRKARGSKRS